MSDIKDPHITFQDAKLIKNNEHAMSSITKRLEKLSKFNVGDYLIAFHTYHDGQRAAVTSSYGVPVKYKVLHIDANKIPYVKALNQNGQPTGDIMPLMGVNENDVWRGRNLHSRDFDFELDPGFVDSVIFEAQDNYDPTEQQRMVASLRKEIIAHNAAHKIKSNDVMDLVTVVENMAVGEIYWFSNKNGMSISAKGWEPWRKGMRYTGYRKKLKAVPYVDVILSNGNRERYMPHNLYRRNIYKAQPRTLNELKNPI